jgi:hypothetical protein
MADNPVKHVRRSPALASLRSSPGTAPPSPGGARFFVRLLVRAETRRPN